MSEVLTLVGVMFVDSIYSCRPRTISTLGIVPCINSAREFIRVNELYTTWIDTIDKHDSHKRVNLRYIDNQLTRQHNLFTRRGRDAETS